MKKGIVSLLVLFLSLGSFISPSQAEQPNWEWSYSYKGLIYESRMLVPLRVVSEAFGAQVKWNQSAKTISIKLDKNTLLLKTGSKNVTINGSQSTYEVAPRIFNNSTYVPAALLQKAFGGYIKYDNLTKTVFYQMGSKVMLVALENHLPRYMRDEEITVLLEKLNETTDLSKFPQIRTYFRPYFTDTFINKLIRRNGIKDNLSFYETDVSPTAVDYLSKTKATIFDSVINPRPFEYHDRLITLTYENGTWKVSDVEINRYEAIIR
ncbi:copper amine oxidase N-terminal domain-containing protein [Bacillus infantis]|uniref:copper amine oxidase N-terminal domain-containing protein n=1 Tax=Bacillus infantis TaxID=324767 RepID=UPI003CF1A139